MSTIHQSTLLDAQLRALRHANDAEAPVSRVLSRLLRHGGLHTMLDHEMMSLRLAPVAARQGRSFDQAALTDHLQAAAVSFFTKLVPDRSCPIPSSLMSHIALPGTGVTYTPPTGPETRSEIPAVFTFVGQFIDHDLTMNALNLFDLQGDPAMPVPDGATPLIDLDSVYGPRAASAKFTDAIYDGDLFVLHDDAGVIDLPRERDGTAIIADGRNDENQMILQLHLLLMRVHNALIRSGQYGFVEAYRETVLQWQRVVLADYLPRIVRPEILAAVLDAVRSGNSSCMLHRPLIDPRTGAKFVRMPHEFSIAFRFGHSQLRSDYKLNDGPKIRLFDNSLLSADPHENHFSDLRGSQRLRADHVIDWDVFFGVHPLPSNLIDGSVTDRVFDLPESAIPDDIKYVGNLPHRNLIRSRQLGLCSGEDLAKAYGIAPISHDDVDTDREAWALYETGGMFQTPLWYYVLREAQAGNAAGGAFPSMLGELGSRLVAEVILGGLDWGPISILRDEPNTDTGTGPSALRNLIDWLEEEEG